MAVMFYSLATDDPYEPPYETPMGLPYETPMGLPYETPIKPLMKP